MADSRREIVPISVLPCVTPPILAVYNEFPLDCIAITGKQIAPSILQIAGSENEISQSGLLSCALRRYLRSNRTHTTPRRQPTHVLRDVSAARRCMYAVGECARRVAVELAARGSSRMNQTGGGCITERSRFYDSAIKLDNR